ncbi:MAG: exo-alpha-sialidase [Planctomycetes bacterium]|nr:exo-alpha-sialidase [Planctomycetota bacterium]
MPPALIDPDLRLVFNDPEASPTPIAAHGDPVFREQAVFESIPGKQGSHAATVAAFPDGELLAAWYSYDGPHELTGAAIYMARHRPGEPQWGAPWLHVDRPEGDGNPVLYHEQDRVWLFQAVVPGGWSTSHIEVQVSEDRGGTWSRPRSLVSPLGANVRYPPVRAADGTLVLPAYDDLVPRSLFFTSSDGRDWALVGMVATSPACLQPSVARLPGGRLLAVMRNSGGGWLWVMASDNHGRSWSPPMDSGFPNPGSAAVLLQLASGNLLLVFNDSPTARVPLSAAISADQGVTWPIRRVLAQGDGTYSYPVAVQTPDGLVHVLYSLNRDRIQHLTFNEAWLAAPNEAGEGP